jgi:hypothetical protein
VRFFLGQQDRPPLPDEVFLPVPDDYESLPEKVRAVSQWALQGNCDVLLKLDDDVVLFPIRTIIPQADYVGWRQEPFSDNYCSGLAYWLSRNAMESIAAGSIPAQPRPFLGEDRWTGLTLRNAGIPATSFPPDSFYWVGRTRPYTLDRQRFRHAYLAGEFTPEEMATFY